MKSTITEDIEKSFERTNKVIFDTRAQCCGIYNSITREKARYKILKAHCRFTNGSSQRLKFSGKSDISNTCEDLGLFRRNLKNEIESRNPGLEIEYIHLMYEEQSDGQ